MDGGIILIFSFVLQGILIFIFLSVGIQKITGHELQVEIFENLKLPQWFRVVTGWVQLVGVAGLIIGFWQPWVAGLAGCWFTVTMLGAIIAHIRVKDSLGKFMPSFVLLVISILLYATI